MKMWRPSFLAAVLLIIGGSVAAQQVDVAATVPVRSPTGSGVRNLTFGEITPAAGASQIVDVPAAAAPVSTTVQSGEFRYDLTANRGMTFNISMPAGLTGTGGTLLALNSNGNQYGGYCVSRTAQCSITAFNPAAGQNITVCRTMVQGSCHPAAPYQSGTSIRVFVGGQLTVPPTARAGTYLGTVTLTIVQVH